MKESNDIYLHDAVLGCCLNRVDASVNCGWVDENYCLQRLTQGLFPGIELHTKCNRILFSRVIFALLGVLVGNRNGYRRRRPSPQLNSVSSKLRALCSSLCGAKCREGLMRKVMPTSVDVWTRRLLIEIYITRRRRQRPWEVTI